MKDDAWVTKDCFPYSRDDLIPVGFICIFTYILVLGSNMAQEFSFRFKFFFKIISPIFDRQISRC